jgi:hypothetical protein
VVFVFRLKLNLRLIACNTVPSIFLLHFLRKVNEVFLSGGGGRNLEERGRDQPGSYIIS